MASISCEYVCKQQKLDMGMRLYTCTFSVSHTHTHTQTHTFTHIHTQIHTCSHNTIWTHTHSHPLMHILHMYTPTHTHTLTAHTLTQVQVPQPHMVHSHSKVGQEPWEHSWSTLRSWSWAILWHQVWDEWSWGGLQAARIPRGSRSTQEFSVSCYRQFYNVCVAKQPIILPHQLVLHDIAFLYNRYIITLICIILLNIMVSFIHW